MKINENHENHDVLCCVGASRKVAENHHFFISHFMRPVETTFPNELRVKFLDRNIFSELERFRCKLAVKLLGLRAINRFSRKLATSFRLRGHRAQRGNPLGSDFFSGYPPCGISRVNVWDFCEILCFIFPFL
jgi:hypothetical protein